MKIFGLCGEYNAVSWYRIINPVGEYGGDLSFKLGQDPDNEGEDKVVYTKGLRRNIAKHGDAFLKEYDYVITKYIGKPEDVVSIQKWMKHSPNTKLVLDVDDNVFEIPKGNSAKSKWPEDLTAVYAYMVKEADVITCSTQPLADYFSMLNPNTLVIPNKVNPDLWKPKRKKGPIKIGWTYSSTHVPDKDAIGNALKIIKDKYPHVIIETTGSGLEGTENVIGCPFMMFPKWLCEKRWDIAIAPLVRNEFNKGKSNIKWLESTMAGSVFVGSDVYPYSNSIEHGKTGFLAKNEKEWVEILSRLIEDKQLRQKVQRNAKKKVLKDYNIKTDNPIKVLERGTQGQ